MGPDDSEGGTTTLNPVQIYTDGLGYKNNVGSAAVIPSKAPHCGVCRYKLGLMKHHMVYEGEAVGLLLALELIKINRIDHHTIILLDNQAVIQA